VLGFKGDYFSVGMKGRSFDRLRMTEILRRIQDGRDSSFVGMTRRSFDGLRMTGGLSLLKNTLKVILQIK